MMKRRVLEVFPLALLFLCAHSAALAMNSEEKENLAPNHGAIRVPMEEEEYQNILKSIGRSTLSTRSAKILAHAALKATDEYVPKSRKKRPISSISSPSTPQTPPRHARAKTPIGKFGTFYGSNTPVKKLRMTSHVRKKITSVVERDISVRAIYSWIMVKEHSDLYIEPGDLVDVEDYLSTDGDYDNKDIDNALYQTERIIRGWIRDIEELVFRTAYIGLSLDTEHRIYGHTSDLKDTELTQSYRKNMIADLVGDAGYNLRMRPLVHHVPEKLLPVFECLVARLFSAQIFSASTLFGNGAAWDRLDQYWKTKKRIEGLEEEGLSQVSEEMRMEIFVRAKLLPETVDK